MTHFPWQAARKDIGQVNQRTQVMEQQLEKLNQLVDSRSDPDGAAGPYGLIIGTACLALCV